MLISNKHKFIFIHIYKNAGTSISSALLPFAANKIQQKISIVATKFGFSYPFGPTPYQGHITTTDLIAKMGKEKFESYFSFAIVRNPWDWQVSLYTYMLKNKNHHQHRLISSFNSFDEYVEWVCAKKVRLQRDFIFSKENEQLVDLVGRFEHLDADFQKICSQIGVNVTLPRLNRSKSTPYQEFYNKRTIELVSKTFAPDIETFGYEFLG